MVRSEWQVVLAALAIFAALMGMAVSIHGMVYDDHRVALTGAASTGLGIALFVVMLNRFPDETRRHGP
ncbi:DUF2964 family protein [Burkholderia sp. WAC0059]|uniref:DUF2964 family protein n=1 Tax=Burkholderia sp. WAC0059 TaxID=2066022 RepID=UPI0015E1413F|nr:DUF2964 family protein [Burkholderia sp. WAC0059]